MQSNASTSSSTDGTSQVDDRSPADRAAFQAASYVRPRPLPRRVPGNSLPARPLSRELAEQGWEQAEPAAHDAIVLGGIHAHSAFGPAA